MAGSETTSLPQFDSLDELIGYFDSHDWGDYLAQMPEAEFEVDIQRRVHLVALDADLADRLTAIARRRHTSSEVLVNRWLREKILTDARIMRESDTEYHEE